MKKATIKINVPTQAYAVTGIRTELQFGILGFCMKEIDAITPSSDSASAEGVFTYSRNKAGLKEGKIVKSSESGQKKAMASEPELLPKPHAAELAPASTAEDEPEENLEELEPVLDSDPELYPEVDDELLAISEHDGQLPAISDEHLPSLPIRDNLQLYLREVSKFPLLTPNEELELTRKVRDTGDTDAAFRIVSSHLRLVVKVAMEFQRRWMQNVLDLIQEGNVGLLRAVDKFDPDKGIKFSYYATFWIKAYILKFIMDNWRMVKIGTTQAQRKLFYNLNKERQKLIAQGFNPDVKTLSTALGVTPEQVTEMQQRLDAADISLDLPVSDENGAATRMDFLPALGPGIEAAYGNSEIAALVRGGIEDLLPTLSEKETFILEHRLLTDDPVTLREIGERYHVTRERIRQLEARLLTKLKNHLSQEIRDFSDDWINP